MTQEEILFFVLLSIFSSLLFIAFFFWIRKINQKRQRGLQELAQQNSWSCEFRPEPKLLYRFKGKIQQIKWSLEARRPVTRKTGGPLYTSWKAPLPNPQHFLYWIGPRPTEKIPSLDFASSLIPFFLKLMIGEEVNTAGLQEISAPSSLQKHFIIYTNAKAIHPKILDFKLESLLHHWTLNYPKKPPSLIYWQRGLQIKCDETVTNPQKIVEIVELGKTALENLFPSLQSSNR